jgi:hypothetical protein
MMLVALTMVAVVAVVSPMKMGAPRVRPLSTHMADLVQRAAARSPTVARLLAEVEASDIILHVELRMDESVPRAMTYLMTSAGGARYVHTTINRRMAPSQLIEMLAHELQHVVEIAGDPCVRDNQTMRARFELLGWQVGRHGPFETDAAVEVERQVRRELTRGTG